MTEKQAKEEWELFVSSWEDNFPHCDSRVLHAAEDCSYCAMEKYGPLHEFRAHVGMSHTGRQDAPLPCIGENERGLRSINSWHGNVPKR